MKKTGSICIAGWSLWLMACSAPPTSPSASMTPAKTLANIPSEVLSPFHLPHLTTGTQIPGEELPQVHSLIPIEPQPVVAPVSDIPPPLLTPIIDAGGAVNWPSAPSDISTIEKSSLNGRIFDNTGAPMDGVKVIARSLNALVSFYGRNDYYRWGLCL